jgi:DUF4097 and DUF4098 domain-containing protein YvlB
MKFRRYAPIILWLLLLSSLHLHALGTQESLERLGLSRVEQTAAAHLFKDGGLMIQTREADIVFHSGAAGENVTAALTGYASTHVTLHTEEASGNLNIFTRYEKTQGVTTREMQLVVFIPDNFIGKIHAASSTGSIELSGLASSDILAQTATGKISAQQLNSGNIELSSVSGEIEITDVSASSITVNTASGAILLSEFRSPRLTAESASGRIEAEGSASSITLNTISGSIELAASDDVTQVEMQTVSGNQDIRLPSGVLTSGTLHSLTGKLTNRLPGELRESTHQSLSWNNNASDAQISAQSISGSITVGN